MVGQAVILCAIPPPSQLPCYCCCCCFCLVQHAAAGAPLLLFDIPLLFETKAESGLDAVVVVSAPEEVQQQRVMARPGVTAEKLQAILARQVGSRGVNRRAGFCSG